MSRLKLILLHLISDVIFRNHSNRQSLAVTEYIRFEKYSSDKNGE